MSLVFAILPAGLSAQEADFARCLTSIRATPLGRRVAADTWERYARGRQPDPRVIAQQQTQPEFTLPIWDYIAVMVDDQFTDNRYSRAHEWSFDGGVRVPASSSPNVVPLPLSDPNAIHPEEAFVAALASCHMLWFLSIAARRGFVIDRYEDDAVGELATNADGRLAMKTVTLRPAVTFGDGRHPARAEVEATHHEAHDACYLSNSVRTEIQVAPAWHDV